jgi:hypothetical protein
LHDSVDKEGFLLHVPKRGYLCGKANLGGQSTQEAQSKICFTVAGLQIRQRENIDASAFGL